jgi:hypothetical protein
MDRFSLGSYLSDDCQINPIAAAPIPSVDYIPGKGIVVGVFCMRN